MIKRIAPVLILLAACSGGSDDETTTAIPIPTNSTDSCIAEINGDLVLCLDQYCNSTQPIEEVAETARVDPLPEPEPTPSYPDGYTPSKSYDVKIGSEWVININMCSDQVQSEDNDVTTNPVPVVVE